MGKFMKYDSAVFLDTEECRALNLRHMSEENDRELINYAKKVIARSRKLHAGRNESNQQSSQKSSGVQ